MSDPKERAVQRYLAFLEDPNTADRELMAELEKQLSTAESPIVKLRLLAEIDLACSPDRVLLEDGFVRYASDWAAENGIPANAFLALGVDQRLLTKAGIATRPVPASKRMVSKTASTKASLQALYGGRKARAKSVPSEAVEKLILATTEAFSVRDIVDVSEATNATVSRVVGILVAAGRVEKIGLLAPQGARGVPPQGYRVKDSENPGANRKAG